MYYTIYTWNGTSLESSTETVEAEEYTLITSDNITGNTIGTENDDSFYVVSGSFTVTNRITVSGSVTLILLDGCDVTFYETGITVTENNSLTITAGSIYEDDIQGTGKLTATVSQSEAFAAIGGENYQAAGTITIHEGIVTATGTYNGAGIGGGYSGDGGTITIYGGTVTANGGTNAAGIGGGATGAGGNITIYGGTVTANGGSPYESHYGGAGIGGGATGAGGNITIYGGTATATSQYRTTTAIGYGNQGTGGNITINNGVIHANSIFGITDFDSLQVDENTIKNLNGIVFIGTTGKVFGNAVLDQSLSISSTQTLEIINGYTLTVDGGSLTIESDATVNNSGVIHLISGAFSNGDTISKITDSTDGNIWIYGDWDYGEGFTLGSLNGQILHVVPTVTVPATSVDYGDDVTLKVTVRLPAYFLDNWDTYGSLFSNQGMPDYSVSLSLGGTDVSVVDTYDDVSWENGTYTWSVILKNDTNPLAKGVYDVEVKLSDDISDNGSNYLFGNASGSATLAVGKDISGAEVSGIKNAEYTGSPITQDGIAVILGSDTLYKDVDYVVTYGDNLNTGTVTVTISGTGNYYGEIKKTFQISPAPLKGKLTVSGALTTGSRLTAVYDSSNDPGEPNLSYSWYRYYDGTIVPIGGASGATYTLTDDDVGWIIVAAVYGTGNHTGYVMADTSGWSTRGNTEFDPSNPPIDPSNPPIDPSNPPTGDTFKEGSGSGSGKSDPEQGSGDWIVPPSSDDYYDLPTIVMVEGSGGSTRTLLIAVVAAAVAAAIFLLWAFHERRNRE